MCENYNRVQFARHLEGVGCLVKQDSPVEMLFVAGCCTECAAAKIACGESAAQQGRVLSVAPMGSAGAC